MFAEKYAGIRVAAVTAVIDKMITLLQANDMTNFLPGLRALSRLGHDAETDPASASEVLKHQSGLYWRMHRGMRSFADIVIYDNDFETRRELNREFQGYKAEVEQPLVSRAR
ncbi:hypothetical protein [Gordonia hankookensis]|uniref:Uncharacterized protein n=1 Tax=Gordonia hankookensis TaxID=589403 RepID=A0ABR7WCX2_9ACTN|nr:hypothetical protein [Gordonia hankookensis]MBD1320613.1 hypothetical protein [Gordonia hankookensis]